MSRDFQGVFSLQDLNALVKELEEGPEVVAFDVETSYSSPEPVKKRSLDTSHPDFFVAGFSITNDTSWARYIPLRHDDDHPFDTVEVWEKFRSILENKKVTAHNYAFERGALYSLKRSGDAKAPIIPKHPGQDTMLLANSLACFDLVGLKYLTKEVLGETQTEYWELFGDVVLTKDGKVSTAAVDKQRFSQLKVSQAVIDYGCDDSALCLELLNILLPRLQEMPDQLRSYAVDLSVMHMIAEMQEFGVAFDWKGLEDAITKGNEFIPILENHVRENLAKLTVDPEVKALARNLNFNSPKQKQELLYKGFGMTTHRLTKTGAMSTDGKTLGILAKQHPEIKGMVHVVEAKKIMSSFLTKYKNDYSEAHDFKIHPTYRIASDGQDFEGGTATGRFSSSSPNIQQATGKWLWSLKHDADGAPLTEGINGRDYWQGNFKDLVVASNGTYQLYFDFANQELRMLAGIANEIILKKAFANGEDLHKRTASMVFGIPISEVTDEQRSKAKTVQFGTIYGIGPSGLADQLASTVEEAQELLQRYKSQFPAVANWDYASRVVGIQNEYVTTWVGRKIRLRNAHSSNRSLVAMAERAAVNYQIQGGSADYVKYAMLRVQSRLKAAGLWGKVMPIVNVHDSLGLECDNSVDPNMLRKLVHDAVVFDPREIKPDCKYTFPTFEVDFQLGTRWGTLPKWGTEKAVWHDEAQQWIVEGAEPQYVDLQPPTKLQTAVNIAELEF